MLSRIPQQWALRVQGLASCQQPRENMEGQHKYAQTFPKHSFKRGKSNQIIVIIELLFLLMTTETQQLPSIFVVY